MGGVSQKGLIASVKSERNNKKGFYTLCNYLPFFGLDKRLEMRKECSLWRAHWPTNELQGSRMTVRKAGWSSERIFNLDPLSINVLTAKGQLISKCPFVVQKTNENFVKSNQIKKGTLYQ